MSKLDSNIIEILKRYKDLIKDNKFEELYNHIYSDEASSVTKLFIDAGVIDEVLVNMDIIPDFMFSGCDNLTSVTIPDSVVRIGERVFFGCTNLEAITVAENNPVYHSAGNCLIETESKTIIAGCKNSVIPADGSVTNIGNYAFSDCIGLTSITIPGSVTSISDSAFAGCRGLMGVKIPGSVTSIADWAFSGCYGLKSVTIPRKFKNNVKRIFKSQVNEINFTFI